MREERVAVRDFMLAVKCMAFVCLLKQIRCRMEIEHYLGIAVAL